MMNQDIAALICLYSDILMKLNDVLSWYNLQDRHILFISNGKWSELPILLKNV